MHRTTVYIADVTPLEDESLFDRLLFSVRSERREKIERLRFAKDRRLSLGAELLLKHALSERGIDTYSVSCGEHGKPHLDGVTDTFFNLSHSGTRVMCAISDCEVGCDVEKIDPEINLSIADRFFVPSETAWIYEAERREDRVERFFRLWTLKESLMKATGQGFALSPRSFSFLMEGKSPTLKNPIEELLPYSFLELSAPDGYCLSVCAREEAMFDNQTSFLVVFSK